jgi:plastocyanin
VHRGVLAFLSSSVLSQTRNPNSNAAKSTQVIEVITKKYEFSPDQIHVKKGTRVQLKLRADDIAHGMKLNLYPEGARKDGSLGLLFEHQQGNTKVKKCQEEIHRVCCCSRWYL